MNNSNCGGEKVQLCAESKDFGGKRFEIVQVIFLALEEYSKVFFFTTERSDLFSLKTSP